MSASKNFTVFAKHSDGSLHQIELFGDQQLIANYIAAYEGNDLGNDLICEDFVEDFEKTGVTMEGDRFEVRRFEDETFAEYTEDGSVLLHDTVYAIGFGIWDFKTKSFVALTVAQAQTGLPSQFETLAFAQSFTDELNEAERAARKVSGYNIPVYHATLTETAKRRDGRLNRNDWDFTGFGNVTDWKTYLFFGRDLAQTKTSIGYNDALAIDRRVAELARPPYNKLPN